MKKILITGACGLLGKNLMHYLKKCGCEVIGVVHHISSEIANSHEFRSIDFYSDWSIECLPKDIDCIIHLAQSSKFRDFPVSAMDVFKVNIESTAKLLDYASSTGVPQFIYASSGGIYGNGEHAFNENASIVPLGQLGYYLGSKACSEILVQSYASLFQVIVLRPFFIYGPGQNRDMLIPRLFDSVVSGKPISLQGSNGIRINPIHVNDATAAVAAAMSLVESATINIAGPDVLSIREICEKMATVNGKLPVFCTEPGVARDLIADISIMREQLHQPQYHLLESLHDVSI